MKPRFIIFLIFLHWSYFAKASSPLEVTLSENAVYAFRFGVANTPALNNYFVKEIARYNYLNLYKTEYTLDFELEVKISERAEGFYELETGITQRGMEGDIYYEKFDLSEVLTPSCFGFKIKVRDGDFEKSLSIADLKTNQNNLVKIGNKKDLPFVNPEFEIGEIEFLYADTDKKRFEEKIITINDYLAFYDLLDFNLTKAAEINPDEKPNVLPAFFKIYDLKRFRKMMQENYPGLNIPEEYDVHFRDNLKKIDIQVRRLETIFAQNTDTLSLSFSTNDLVIASDVIIKMQNNYLEALRKSNYLFEPVYLQITDFFCSAKDWMNLGDELHKMASENTAPEIFEGLLADLNSQLYQSYTTEAELQIANENYTVALLFLNNAETLCSIHPDTDCELFTFHKLSQSKYGIYDSYLSVANSASNANNPELAYKYLKLAKAFQQKNNNLILTSGVVDINLENLAWVLLNKGNNQLKEGTPEEALNSFVAAQEIYQLINVHTYDDLLEKQIGKTLLTK